MSMFGAYLGQVAHSFFILFDDVAALTKPALAAVDDIWAISKPAMTKSAGVVIDDAAVGAGTVGASAIRQSREYTVWTKITVGSILNKIILATLFIILSQVAPIVPQFLLGCGGFYLAYEGTHKIFHAMLHSRHADIWWKLIGWTGAKPASTEHAAVEEEGGVAALLQKWAARDDFFARIARFVGVDQSERTVIADLLTLDIILATEILLVAMGSAGTGGTADLIAILGFVGLATTLLVYVPILGIMRSDNLAAWLEAQPANSILPRAGRALRASIPKILKALGIIGTAAMLEVGGGILAHKIPGALATVFGHATEPYFGSIIGLFAHAFDFIPFIGGLLGAMLVGILGGALVIRVATLPAKFRKA